MYLFYVRGNFEYGRTGELNFNTYKFSKSAFLMVTRLVLLALGFSSTGSTSAAFSAESVLMVVFSSYASAGGSTTFLGLPLLAGVFFSVVFETGSSVLSFLDAANILASCL